VILPKLHTFTSIERQNSQLGPMNGSGYGVIMELLGIGINGRLTSSLRETGEYHKTVLNAQSFLKGR
jgi:hypothetical protein